MPKPTPLLCFTAVLSLGPAVGLAHDKRCLSAPYGDAPDSVAQYQSDPDKPLSLLQEACEAKFSRAQRQPFYTVGITDIEIEEHYPTEIATWYRDALRSRLRDSATPMSIMDFALDGKRLAQKQAFLVLSGMYIKQGGVEFLYADTQSVLQSHYSIDATPPTVGLLTEEASRSFRKLLLLCQAHPTYAQVGCQVTLWGHATMCAQTNAFGVARELPCVHVVDGE